MLILHKHLSNGFSEAAYQFGIRRLQRLELLWKGQEGKIGPVQESHFVFNSYVRIKHAPPHQYIWVQTLGDGRIYEFATGAFDEITADAITASGVAVQDDLSADPLFSQEFTPTGLDGDPTWREVAPGYFFGRDDSEDDFFQTFLSYQFQGVHEAVHWPDNSVESVVHSAWGMTNGRINTVGQCDALHSDGGTKGKLTRYWYQGLFDADGGGAGTDTVNTYNFFFAVLGGSQIGSLNHTAATTSTVAIPQFDLLFDIPPAYYHRDGEVLGGIGPYRDDYTWYRHGAVIESDLGNLFFVVADSKGGFMFYRARAYWDDDDVLDACVDQPGFPGIKSPASTAIDYIRVVPTYPAWVTVPADGVATPLQWWNWNFNKDGTKAATVAMSSEDRAGWVHHSECDDPERAQNPSWHEDWFVDPATHPANEYEAMFDEAYIGSACRKDLPGLVEVSISIVETGTGTLDFTPSVTVLQEDYFGDSGRYWVDVGYAYPDLSIPEDSLVTAEIECYRNDEDWYRDGYGGAWGNPDGSDFDVTTSQIIMPAFGSSWVVRDEDDAEIYREVLQYKTPITSFLPMVNNRAVVVPAGAQDRWMLNSNARDYAAKVDRVAASGGKEISIRKGMFSIGGLAYLDDWGADPFEIRYDAEVVACDLRSLSYVMRQRKLEYSGSSPNLKETIKHKVVAFEADHVLTTPGKLRHCNLLSLTGYVDHSTESVFQKFPTAVTTETYVDFTMPDEPASQYSMDKDLHEQVYTVAGLSRLPCYTHHELRTTPAGDWSLWVVDEDAGIVDVLHSTVPDPAETTTHREAFNEAYGLALAESYFGTTSSTTAFRNTGGFGLSRNWLPRQEDED